MKCTKCGQELMEDALFCVNCGAKIEVGVPEPATEVQAEEQPEPAPEVQAVELQKPAPEVQAEEQPEPAPEMQAEEQPVPASEVQAEEQPEPAPEVQAVVQPAAPAWNGAAPANVPQKKKSSKGIFVLVGVAALAIVAVAIFAAVKLIGALTSGSDQYAVYMKDDKLMYTENVKKDKEAVEICEIRNSDNSDYWYYNAAQLTEDNKYIYFYDKVDSSGVGRLCRIERKKISKNTEKNEKNIEEISSNVSSYEILGESDQVLYKKENGKLILLDGKKEKDIDSNVNAYSYDTDHKTIIYSKNDDGEKDLYVYSLSSDDSEKIDGNISDIYSMYNSEFLLYMKEGSEDEGGILYIANGDGDAEKIAENVIIEDLDSENMTVYYLQQEEKSEALYSFVDDSYADSDAELKEPEIKDYLEAATETDAMSEEEYNYYTEHPEYKDGFYNWLYYDSETQLYYTYKYVEDELGETQSEEYYYDDTIKQWYHLDKEAYLADYEAYDGAEDRIELREDLKEEEYEWTSYTLCSCKAGEEPVVIAENIDMYSISVNTENQIVIYEKENDSEVGKVSMDEIDGVYDVWEIIEESSEDEAGEYYYRIASGEEQELEIDGDIASISVSENGKNIVIVSDYTSDGSILTLYEKKDDILEKQEEIADNAQPGCWIDDKYYYYADVDTSEYAGDLCYYYKGKNERLIKNIYTGGVRIYSGDQYLGLSDYDYDGGDLKLYDSKGESTKIGNSVTSYAYLDKDCILYIKDSDLYVYTGKEESRKIDRNVLHFICQEAEGTTIYY